MHNIVRIPESSNTTLTTAHLLQLAKIRQRTFNLLHPREPPDKGQHGESDPRTPALKMRNKPDYKVTATSETRGSVLTISHP